MEFRIGNIMNYYGGLFIERRGEKFYWSIEDESDSQWEEIPKSLFDELIKFENARVKKERMADAV